MLHLPISHRAFSTRGCVLFIKKRRAAGTRRCATEGSTEGYSWPLGPGGLGGRAPHYNAAGTGAYELFKDYSLNGRNLVPKIGGCMQAA